MLLAQAGDHRCAGSDGLIVVEHSPQRKPIGKRDLRVTQPFRPGGRRPQQFSRPHIEPEEAGDERRARAAKDLARRADGLDAAAVHHHYRFGKRERLSLVVGHIDGGEAETVLQHLELQPHLVAQLRIEIGQRLVEQDKPWLVHQRASERNALLLSAAQFRAPACRGQPTARRFRESGPTRAARSAFAIPRTLSGKPTLSATDICGHTA